MASILHEQDMSLVYGSDQELNTGLSSEKLSSPELPIQVQGMANSVYTEFKRMMSMYGEDSIKELMPLIVTILEALDRSLTECNENAVEIEMLRDDNEQLATQFDRERQLRRTTEQQLMVSEDHNETTTRELRSKADSLETTTRHLELKCKNYTDQIERLQERESEIKKEYSILHERHTEMIQSYMEHIERTKILQQQQSYTDSSQSPHNKNQDSSDTGQSADQTTPSDNPDLSQSCLKDEHVKPSGLTPTSEENNHDNFQASDIKKMQLKVKNAVQTHLKNEKSHIRAVSVKHRQKPCDRDVTDNNLQALTSAQQSQDEESVAQEWVSAEVKEMLEKDDLNMEDKDLDHDVENTGIENVAFEKTMNVNESSLFAELTEQDINDVDEGADILAEGLFQDSGFDDYNGMSREVENLINENAQLMATKNALNVVKDDLIQKVDQLTTQQTLLKEELQVNEKAKTDLQEKVKDFEKQILRLKQELSNVASGSNNENSVIRKTEEEDGLPLSQRKRFTRVEMARVLMERNQYKERLMELQEAVRWTETLRASRASADVNNTKTKTKSNIFQFFSRLFTSSSNDINETAAIRPQLPRRSFGGGDVNMTYNVPSSKVVPRSRSAQFSLYGRSPTIDALREEPQVKSEPVKREVQPKMSDSRLQACGWSLPNTPGTPKEGSRTVPVPVFCAPLFNDDSDAKLWCATAINLFSGRTKDGGMSVGASSTIHDNISVSSEEGRSRAPSRVDKLNEELQEESSKLETMERKQTNLSSFVWLVAGSGKTGKGKGGNVVCIMNACEPNKYLDQFNVGSNDTNILCIANVPGADADDFLVNYPINQGSSKHSNSTSDSSSSEVATEATEDLITYNSSKKVQTKGVTEHVFTDSSGVHPSTSTTSTTSLTDSTKIGKIENIRSPVLPHGDKNSMDADDSSESTRLASLQPTVWLGAQNGYVYVHSAISNWRKCLHQLRLKDSVLAIVHLKGNVLAGLADGTVAFFRRHDDGVWNLSNYHLLDLGRPHHSIRCMAVVYDNVWCAYRNKVHIVEPTSMKIKASFDAHPRSESQVRQLAWVGDGVWVSIRLDSTLRLYHARTLQHLQDVDVEPYVSKVLGSGKLGFSFVRITALTISNHRLWIGTGNGVIMSVPLSEVPPESNKASTLERNKTCMKYQETLAACGLTRIKCLLCSRLVSITNGPIAATHQCWCRAMQQSNVREGKRTRMSKRAGTLLRAKFLPKRGSKSNTSGPVLSSSVRDRPGGVIRVYSDPVSERISPGTFIPYCSMANAQLSFHGFRDSAKFFVAVPGCVTVSPSSSNCVTLSPLKFPRGGGREGTLVVSGGGGYVDFRKGDLGAMTPEEKKIESIKAAQGQKSHVIVWQLTHS